MRNEARADHLANQRRQIGRHVGHLLAQVAVQFEPVLGQRRHALRKRAHRVQIDLRNLHAHGRLGRVQNRLRQLGVAAHNGLNGGQKRLRNGRAVADTHHERGKHGWCACE